MSVEFDEWYTETRASLGAALRAWCGQEDLAAEALDEAFVRALERWSRVGSLASPSGWVWQTPPTSSVAGSGVDGSRTSCCAGGPPVPPTSHAAPPPDVDLQRALLELTERQRSAIVLYYLADLPVRQVAEVLGVAPGTVEATLHQARQRLHGALDDGTTPARQREPDGAAP